MQTTQAQRLVNAFLSTPSARRATQNVDNPAINSNISIHALREEGDANCPAFPLRCYDFYPRPPRGGRPGWSNSQSSTREFLSTPSARRATSRGQQARGVNNISIHALREEGDPPEAPAAADRLISIHALREEGDAPPSKNGQTGGYFYPRPPRGGRQQKQRQNLYFQTNYTTFCTNLEEP